MLLRGLVLAAAMAVITLLSVGSAREVPVAQATVAHATFIGDVDCDLDVDVVDAIEELRGVNGLPTPTAGCLEVSGDTDCDADRDVIDVLRLLSHIAGLEVTANPGCLVIGQTVVHVPAPPAAFQLPAGSPEIQAAALAEAVGPNSADPLAGWLAVYNALGIPVFGDDGSPLGTTGDDSIGPDFWRVWYAAVMATSQSSISLPTLARGFTGENAGAVDVDGAAAALLADLRADAVSVDPEVRMFGLLTAAIVARAPIGVDMLDPAVTADEVMVPGDLAELLSWAAIRELMFAVVQHDTGSAGALLAPAAAASASTPCTREEGTDPETAAWANWVIGTLSSGGTLPGMLEGKSVKGLVQHLEEEITGTGLAEKIGKIAPVVNAVTSLTTLAMMLAALDFRGSMDPVPMQRTNHAASNGETADLSYQLFMDPGKLPDDNGFGCLASYLLNVFGVSLTFPAGGVVTGADVQFRGRQGFPSCPICHDEYVFMDYAQFGGRGDTILTTNGNGEVTLTVTGKAQAVEIPDTADRWPREFSISVYAQPQAETAQTLFGVLFTGFVSHPAAGLLNAVIEAVKANHWYLDTPVYPIIDWRIPCASAISVNPVSITRISELPCQWTGTATAETHHFCCAPSNDYYDEVGHVDANFTFGNLKFVGSGATYDVIAGHAEWSVTGHGGCPEGDRAFSYSGTNPVIGAMDVYPDLSTGELKYSFAGYISGQDRDVCFPGQASLTLPAGSYPIFYTTDWGHTCEQLPLLDLNSGTCTDDDPGVWHDTYQWSFETAGCPSAAGDVSPEGICGGATSALRDGAGVRDARTTGTQDAK